jgi:tRNA pseudouridine38-40 synthase
MEQQKEKKMHFYLVSISYDGSDFAGWATQPNKFTIQGYIEHTLSKIFQKKVSVLAASRTDKGVHAREQKFTLRLHLNFSEKKLLTLLKKALDRHISVKTIKKVNNNFHPIRWVISKEYRYFINVSKHNIFWKKYRWEYNLLLETKKLNNILQIKKHYCR